jgi:hypothetical protein
LVKIIGSRCSLSNLLLDGSTITGGACLTLTPEIPTQTSQVVNQNYNYIQGIYISGNSEGIVLQCGPDVAGVDSGCWYNTFVKVDIYGADRAIWLKDGPNASSSGVNRNQFIACRVGQDMNTGLQIDSGDTNSFIAVSFEGITKLGGPNTVPTAAYVKQSGLYSGDNNTNRFISCTGEANTLGLRNENSYTELVSSNFDSYNFVSRPILSIGGLDASITPQVGVGQLFQSSSQIPGYNNNVNYLLGLSGAYCTSLTVAKTATVSASGGSSTTYSIEKPYTPGGSYLISRGAVDAAGTSYAHRVSIYTETSSGTFIESTKLVNAITAGVTFAADDVTRFGALLRSTVSVTKTATVFNNYCSVIQIA